MLKIGERFIELQSVDSTNNYAMALVQQGLESHGTAVFTHQQTAGKGQRGKSWHTHAGENIMMSLIVEPATIQVLHPFLLSASVALGAFDFFSNYAGDDTKIKWPNDIYWRDRKAAGILIENVIKGNDWQFAIVGIGININQTLFAEGVKNPVSLKQITGKTFDTIAMAKELCSFLQNRLKQIAIQTPQQIIDGFNTHVYKSQQTVKLKKDNAVFETTIKQVSLTGQLITSDVIERSFDFGEVEWVL